MADLVLHFQYSFKIQKELGKNRNNSTFSNEIVLKRRENFQLNTRSHPERITYCSPKKHRDVPPKMDPISFRYGKHLIFAKTQKQKSDCQKSLKIVLESIAMRPVETPKTKDLGRRYRATCAPITAQ